MPVNTPAMPTALIDTHIHFDDDRFDDDRAIVYDTAKRAGVHAMVIPATMQSRWQKIQSICRQYDHIYPTHGLHPLFCARHDDHHLDELKALAVQGVAIGECGLDKQKETIDLPLQRHFFAAQIDLAKELGMPLIIHARNTVEEVTAMLKQADLNREHGNGVIHSYNGSLQQAHRLLDLNFKLSFGGPVTFQNARRIHELVVKLPLSTMMLETDAPDQSGSLHRGTRNEPQWLPEILRAVAELRGESAEQIAASSNNNAKSLFQLPG